MKTTTVLASLLFVCAAGCLVGCSKDKAKEKTTPTAPAPSAARPSRPAPDITADQPVSPSLAVSADIAAACGLKAPGTPAPKFDYDKDELTEPDREVLAQLATCLMTGALKGKSVLMIGRADPRGTEEYNMGLGSRRSHSVSQYLVRLGVAQAQLEVTTRGSLDATGTDEATWKQDRRVDVQLATN
ncbi:MAG TPA: OmpA family protein [Kofleriaceae bacterium]|nr:OmpA family protein [Kofleriaceae bacterium]